MEFHRKKSWHKITLLTFLSGLSGGMMLPSQAQFPAAPYAPGYSYYGSPGYATPYAPGTYAPSFGYPGAGYAPPYPGYSGYAPPSYYNPGNYSNYPGYGAPYDSRTNRRYPSTPLPERRLPEGSLPERRLPTTPLPSGVVPEIGLP